MTKKEITMLKKVKYTGKLFVTPAPDYEYCPATALAVFRGAKKPTKKKSGVRFQDEVCKEIKACVDELASVLGYDSPWLFAFALGHRPAEVKRKIRVLK
jgi:hypothetical protein